MTKERKFNIGYFILGLVFLGVSILAFQNPANNLAALVIFFSILAIFKGVLELVTYKKIKDIEGINSKLIIVIGVVDILIGLFFLFHLALGMIVSPFVFAIWFICDSIAGILRKNETKQISKNYYRFSLVVNILGIIIGVLLFFNPLFSALTLATLIAFYFLVVGINYLLSAF